MLLRGRELIDFLLCRRRDVALDIYSNAEESACIDGEHLIRSIAAMSSGNRL
jgi:hypothetical protein